MIKSRRELIDMALSNLGVLAAGQQPETEDLQRVDAFVDAMLADLRVRDIIDIPSGDEFDIGVFADLAVCLANTCRHAFGLSGNPELQAAAMAAEQKLLVKSAQKPTYSILRGTYF